jgi:predicted nucleic acid-binding protein
VSIVVDGSIALSWVLPDESAPATQHIRERIEAGIRPLVPSHWQLEVANALWMAERRNRISQADTSAALAAFQKLDIETDAETAQRAGSDTLALARQHTLSIYDAAYLELAMRRGAPLASLDGSLRNAARKLKVAVLPKAV